jgi:rod shape-determining protein MreD
MKRLLIFIFLLIGTMVQSFLPPPAVLGSVEWPVLTGLVIYIALRARRGQVIYASLMAGLFYDAFSLTPLGVSLPLFLLLGLGVHALGEEVFADQLITYVLLGPLAVLFKNIYFATVFAVSGLRPVSVSQLAVRLGGSLLLGVMIVPLVYLVMSLLMRSKHRRPAW